MGRSPGGFRLEEAHRDSFLIARTGPRISPEGGRRRRSLDRGSTASRSHSPGGGMRTDAPRDDLERQVKGAKAVTQTTRKRDKMRGQRGQTMVEFAIVLPIFLLLLLGIAQGGIAFNNYIQLTDATRAGARFGAPLACSGSCDRSSSRHDKGQGLRRESRREPGRRHRHLHVAAGHGSPRLRVVPVLDQPHRACRAERQPQLVHNGACGMTRRLRTRSERGQMLAIMAVSIVALCACGAFVMDVGSWFRAHRATQSVADAAALAGAQKLPAATLRRAGARAGVRRQERRRASRRSSSRRTRSRTTRSRSGPSASLPGSSRTVLGIPRSTSVPTRLREPGTSARRSTRRRSPSTRRTRCSRAAAARASTSRRRSTSRRSAPAAFRIVNIDGSHGGTGQQILSDWI